MYCPERGLGQIQVRYFYVGAPHEFDQVSTRVALFLVLVPCVPEIAVAIDGSVVPSNNCMSQSALGEGLKYIAQ